MKKLYIIALALFWIPCIAQAPDMLWQKSVGGAGTEFIKALLPTDDGGCISAGFSNSNTGLFVDNHGSNDVLVVKFDSTGGVEWQKQYGGAEFDIANDIKKTADGYIIVGGSQSNDGDATFNHGEYDYWVIKISETGILQWQKSIGGSNYDLATQVELTSDGGFLVAGETSSIDGDRLPLPPGLSNKWIVKLDADGNILWHTAFFSNIGTGVVGLAINSTDGFAVGCNNSQPYGVVTGNTTTYYPNCYIKHFDASGNPQWTFSYGGSYQENLGAISPTEDGGYIVAGGSYSNDMQVSGHHGTVGPDGVYDIWIYKINSAGAIQWQKTLGGNYGEFGQDIVQTADGGYILTGYANSNNGDVVGNHGFGYSDFWVVKLTSAGNLSWQKCLGGTQTEVPYAITQSSDGAFFIGGYNSSTDGDVTQNFGGYDGWVIKMGAEPLSIDEHEYKRISVAPNPVDKNFSITGINEGTILIVDKLGKMVKTVVYVGLPIDVQSLDSGLYFVRIETGNEVKIVKVIKE